MSLVPLLTHGSKKQNLWVPYFSTGQLNASTISTGSITANTAEISSLIAEYVSTEQLFANAGTFSTFSTSQIVIDAQTLNATPTELLLNGIPIATLSSLSSIADWSYEPALSTVQMAGNDLDQGGTISSLNVRAGNGFFLNLVAFNSLFVSSNTSTISSVIDSADLGIFSTLNAGEISSGQISCASVYAPVGEISSLVGDSANFSTISCMSLSSLMASFSSITTEALTLSTLQVNGLISTPDIETSTINGAAFGASSITVEVVGVSSLVANAISSVGAEIRTALVSTIQFKPSFDVGLNFDTAALGNALQGGLTRLGIGAGVGFGVVGSGLLGAVFSRPANTSYNTNAYYQYAVPTQLQFSTLGTDTSSFTRLVSSSGAGNEVPGVEVVLSSIISSGTLCLRSLGDPTNLADPSTFTSSIQAFGEWVPVPPETLQVISTFATASVSSLSVSSVNGLNAASLENVSSFNDLYASSLSTAIILGANSNLFGIGIQGLEIQTSPSGQVWISSPQTNIAGLINCSSVGATNISARNGGISSLQVSSLAFAQTGGLSSLMFLSTAASGVTAATSTLTTLNTDFNLGPCDLYAQQVRLGLGAVDGTAPEILMYGSDGSQRTLGSARGDRTIRTFNTSLGSVVGYMLDTFNNAPFFSTINNSTCMMAYFPSTLQSTIGVSTLAIIPPIQVYGGFYSSTTQGVAGANTITPLTYTSESVNVGGITFAGSTINVPIAGTYEITHSIQFDTTSGGTNEAFFWLKKNGTDIPQSASIVSVVNNGETLGTISLIDTAAAGDQYAVCIASADTNMTAKAFPISSFCPAIPSLITNLKRLG